MSWQKTKISEFLIERTDRFKPDEANELGLPRIEKIDFSGTIYINNFKPTKTGMILVKDGDLVISGINVEKGALAIYRGETNALATIHYSSYMYDENKIDIKYLKWYLQSNIFRKILKEQVKGGIKTEIKPKTFLNLEIMLPDVETQKSIASKLNKLEWNVKDLDFTCFCNKELIDKLRQSILQNAIQGKLVPQNPNDEPASELLKRIKSKKEQLIKEGKIKKEKFIINDEIPPYNIPSSWSWIRWNEILSYDKYSMKRGPFGSALRKDFFVSKGIRVFEQYNAINDDPYWARYYITKEKYEELKAFTANAGDLLISCSGVTLGRITEIPNDTDMGIINQALLKLNLNKKLISNAYFKMLFKSKYMQDLIFEKALGSAIPNMVGVVELKRIFIPLPPKEEQKRIVARVDELMQLCDKLESENNNAQKSSSELLQSLMQKYFTQEV